MARDNYTDYADAPIPSLPDQAAQPYGAATVQGYHDQAEEYLTNHGIYHIDPQTQYDLAFRLLQVLAESEIRDPFGWHDRPNYRGLVASLVGELAHEYRMIDVGDADSIKDLLESAQEAMSMHSRRAADPAQDALDILGAYADG